MTSPDAFLADACEHPDDLAPRLVFADWLDDHGDGDRAEFIRLQVRLEAMAEDDPERFDLEERAGDLLASHRDEWLGKKLPSWLRREPVGFRRGLPGEIRVPPGRFLSHGDKLVRALPLVRLTLAGLNARAAELAASPALRGVPELEIDNLGGNALRLGDFLANFQSDRLRHLGLEGKPRERLGRSDALAAWPGRGRLSSLALRHVAFADDRLAALLGAADLGELQRLDLSHTEVGPRTCAALAGSERLAGLRHLCLRESNVGSAGLHALAGAGWTQMESLRISLREFDDASAGAFAAAGWVGGLVSLTAPPVLLRALLGRATPPPLRHLTTLWGDFPYPRFLSSDLAAGLTSLVVSDQIGALHLPAFATAPKLAGLRRLAFGSCYDRTSLIADLIDSPHLAELRELVVWGSPLTEEAERRLPHLAGLSRLRALTLDNCFLGPDTVAALARSPQLHGLRRLDLSRNSVGDAGLRALLDAPWASSLRELRLYCADLSPAGVAALAMSPAMANLRVLELDHHVLGPAAAHGLVESPYLGRLLRLRIGPQRPNGDQLLRERFGGALILG